MNPKSPINPDKWQGPLPAPDAMNTPYPTQVWMHINMPIVVISAVEPSGSQGELEYHISISPGKGRRKSSMKEIRTALHSFQMIGADAHNRKGDKARHYFMGLPH